MFFSFRSKPQYVALEEGEYDEEGKGGSRPRLPVRQRATHNSLGWAFGLLVLTGLSVFSVYSFFAGSPTTTTCAAPPSVTCIRPPIRREWRTLDRSDKKQYINAVQCLGTKPSKLRANGTLYDDFPWVHQLTVPKAHASAPFLPWHRYYIHAYEKALKEDCDYTGHLPYWDWSQDYQSFASAPVWDPTTGFGGDGDATGASTVGDGRCVVDGPFAGTEALYYAEDFKPHCLSRGFEQGARLKELGELVRPEVLEELMRKSDFETFAPELERRAHTFISRSIRGDFSKYTGPYDPVFFLHHANLDRLWAKWQMLDPEYQMTAYRGKANSLTSEPASLTDLLDIGGLLEPVPVSNVMETTEGMFCYQY